MRSKFIIRNKNRGNPLEIKVTTFPGGELVKTTSLAEIRELVTSQL